MINSFRDQVALFDPAGFQVNHLVPVGKAQVQYLATALQIHHRNRYVVKELASEQ